MNDTLKQIHEMLLARHNALADALGDQADPAKADAILTEMQEILHRIDLIQGLLFRQSSNALENTLANITRANKELARAIKSVDDVASFIKSVTGFLKFVDQAIDIAKQLAPLAV